MVAYNLNPLVDYHQVVEAYKPNHLVAYPNKLQVQVPKEDSNKLEAYKLVMVLNHKLVASKPKVDLVASEDLVDMLVPNQVKDTLLYKVVQAALLDKLANLDKVSLDSVNNHLVDQEVSNLKVNSGSKEEQVATFVEQNQNL